jgi:hypothetical protein
MSKTLWVRGIVGAGSLNEPQGAKGGIMGPRETLIRSWRRRQARPPRIFRGNSQYRRVVQGRKASPIVNQGITHAKRGRPDITGDMHPIGIAGTGFRRSNVDMDVGAV